MARKTEIYTWRVAPALKAGLEDAAREEQRSVAELLDHIVAERLAGRGKRAGADAQRQRLLHARAASFAGRIRGSDPNRAERSREIVRARLRRLAHAR